MYANHITRGTGMPVPALVTINPELSFPESFTSSIKLSSLLAILHCWPVDILHKLINLRIDDNCFYKLYSSFQTTEHCNRKEIELMYIIY